jgi:pilus assembly protein CpaE
VADEVLVSGACEEHPSGLQVLAQPYDLTELQDPTSEEVGALLTLLRSLYDVVLVDLGSRIDVASLTAAQFADRVALVATSDVPALRDARRVLGLMRRLDVPQANITVVLNKVHKHTKPSVSEAREQLDMERLLTLSRDDDACRRADTLGHTLADVAPRALLTQEVGALWRALHGEPMNIEPRGWFWTRQ